MTALPRNTTPTWEVELLISGVAVFAMLQLPGLLDDALFALQPRLDAGWGEPLRIVYVYLKAAAVLLALTFSAHLLLRAHWIAAVGMHSIYPDGVRWDRLRIGPVQRAVEQARAGDHAALIERADNRATTVFAAGVMMATILLSVTLMISVAFGLLLLAMTLGGLQVDVPALFIACVGLVILPTVLAMFIDRRFGAKLAPDGLARRLLAGVFRFYGGFGFSRGTNALGLLSSHIGERRTTLAIMAVMLPVMIAVLAGASALRSPERIGDYALFPEPADASGRSLVDAHYDRRRDPARDPAVPYIQDLVASGPYLLLTVPFVPGAGARAMRARCTLPEDVDPPRVLDCLATLHAVSLDGKPVAGLRYDTGTDPRTERPVLLAMIDLRSLAPGRHELRIARVDAKDDESRDWLVPFWR